MVIKFVSGTIPKAFWTTLKQHYHTAHLDTIPAVGTVFDTSKCKGTLVGMLTNCEARDRVVFQAASSADCKEAGIIKELDYKNRFSILCRVDAIFRGGYKVFLGETDRRTVIFGTTNVVEGTFNVSHSGAPIVFQVDGAVYRNMYGDRSRVDLVTNYMYPDINQLSVHALAFNNLTTILKETYDDVASDEKPEVLDSRFKERVTTLEYLLNHPSIVKGSKKEIETIEKIISEYWRIFPRQQVEESRISLAQETLHSKMEEISRELDGFTMFLSDEILRLECTPNMDKGLLHRMKRILEDVRRSTKATV